MTDLYKQLITDVRDKKDLQTLSADFIIYWAKEELRLHPKLRILEEKSEDQRSKSTAYKDLIKFIRSKARKPFAIFQVPNLVTKRQELLQTAKLSNEEEITTILESHLSTKERLPFYNEILKNIPTNGTILDIACGLNPIAYFFFSSNRNRYIAQEASEIEAESLNAFFKNNKLNATAISFDLVREIKKLKEIKSDICFAFKTLDTLESQRLYVTYDILKNITAKTLVASFPIKSISGIRMDRSEQIHWFEKMLGRTDFTFTTYVIQNEVFYICTRK